MQFARVRSGLAESFHDVSVHAVDAHGDVVFSSGEPTTPLYLRSAIKPIQAAAAARTGLRLPPEHLALTCASHGGFPVHLAIARQILDDHGLDERALQCPPSDPLSKRALRVLHRSNAADPRPLHHNCSGKHSGFLAACVTAGWDHDTYLDKDHPLQASIVDLVAEVTGDDPEPVGVDGCGAPTLRGTIIGLARAFARLTSDPEFGAISDAMTRFGPLVSDNVSPEGRFGTTWGGPSKAGAEGLFVAGRGGMAIAAKSHEGSSEIAVSAVIEAAGTLGWLPRASIEHLADVRHTPVIGGGRRVGRLELVSP